MFEEVKSHFQDFSNKRNLDSAGDIESEYRIEAIQRLAHLEFIVSRIRQLSQRTPASDMVAEAEYTQMSKGADLQDLHQFLYKVTPLRLNEIEIMVLTEAFYYCASRARQVIRKLPGLGSFEAIGVRDVRNKLLEHPEGKDSEVIENGFSVCFERGPIIKGVRRVDKVNVFPDAGLYPNCQEFVANLKAVLLSAQS